MEKPYSPSCDRNRDAILHVLRDWLPLGPSVLEIGSGTGQHAVHFAAALPHRCWQTSECKGALPGLRLWLDEAQLPNTPAPLELDVSQTWPALPLQVDAVFTANTLHIMGWSDVQACFAALPSVLPTGGRLVVYGPFNESGQYTSESNAQFDRWLRVQHPRQGLRDLESIERLAQAGGFQRLARIDMPANNLCLVWERGDVNPQGPP